MVLLSLYKHAKSIINACKSSPYGRKQTLCKYCLCPIALLLAEAYG